MSAGISAKLCELIPPDRVSVDPGDRAASSRDCWPRGLIAGSDPLERPLAVVWPEHTEEIAALVELARCEGFALSPLGAGSGVCGGFWPDARTVVVDLKRLTDFRITDDGAEVHAGAGLLGWELERRLAKLGKTAGHFPSSILCSTVGGWVAARGAGQCSGRYGKIEDMVTELSCVLGSGRELTTRAQSGGPQLTEWLTGSEGSLGILTRIGLRLFPAPVERALLAFSFATFEDGAEALRAIYQGGLRPAVARLYDPVDSLLHASSKSQANGGKPTNRGGLKDGLEALTLRGVLAAPGQLVRLVEFLQKQGRVRSRLLLLFENVDDPRAHAELAARLCLAQGGHALGEEPVRQWLEHRYDVSFRQSKVFLAGAFSDTLEVSAPWSRLQGVYQSVRTAVASRVLLMAHVSHCYPDGAAIYFTFVGHARSREKSLLEYDGVWADALGAAVSAGASVSHHHGVGRSKAGVLAEESGAAARRLLTRAWDPAGVLNPGVLGYPDGVAQQEEPTAGAPAILIDEVSQLVDLDARLSLDEIENLLWKRGLELGVTAPGDTALGDFVARGLPGAPSPWDDPVWRPIAGLSGRLATGESCRLRAAPRRAEGPDLAACFVGAGGALGTIERVTWAALRRGVRAEPTPGKRPRSAPPTPAEQAAFEDVVIALGRS